MALNLELASPDFNRTPFHLFTAVALDKQFHTLFTGPIKTTFCIWLAVNRLINPKLAAST